MSENVSVIQKNKLLIPDWGQNLFYLQTSLVNAPPIENRNSSGLISSPCIYLVWCHKATVDGSILKDWERYGVKFREESEGESNGSVLALWRILSSWKAFYNPLG